MFLKNLTSKRLIIGNVRIRPYHRVLANKDFLDRFWDVVGGLIDKGDVKLIFGNFEIQYMPPTASKKASAPKIVEEPKEEPTKVEEPKEESVKAGESKEEPTKVEESKEEPTKVEEPKKEPKEEPTKRKKSKGRSTKTSKKSKTTTKQKADE